MSMRIKAGVRQAIKTFRDWLTGKQKDKRFLNQPAWLRMEMLDRAATKRSVRGYKRMEAHSKRVREARDGNN